MEPMNGNEHNNVYADVCADVCVVPPTLAEFALLAYERHDRAHNIEHVYRVLDYARKIVIGERIVMTAVEAKELPYAILLHDARDHKLVNKGICLSAEDIRRFLHSELGESSAEKILVMHTRCSWSNRKTSECLPTSDWMRRVLQDADWLDALGDIGIERSEDYARDYGANDEEVIIHTRAHILDKLLLIPKEFTYETSRQIAADCGLIDPLNRYLVNGQTPRK